MTTTDTPSTGSTPAIQDAGQQLLDQLHRDAEHITPADRWAYKLGCVVSALALYAPAGSWLRYGLYDHPDRDRDDHTRVLPDVEVLARTPEDAAAIVQALEWPHPPVTRREVWSESGRTHVITLGVLFDSVRVAIVALEPAGGAS